MPAFLDLTGHRYGRLTVERLDSIVRQSRWQCRCDCGSSTVVGIGNLRNGAVRSCGCIKREMLRERETKHGLRRSPEYAIWCTMKARCHNPNAQYYGYYGARGIAVCERWRNSFARFIEDMGRRPAPSLSLERVNNDGNYEPSNCVWATRSEQSRNRRHWGSVCGRKKGTNGKDQSSSRDQ